MLTFKEFDLDQYIVEAAASSGVANDDKGKLHELLLAKHLHPSGQLPAAHRAESTTGAGGTPKEVHDRLKEKVGKAAYNEINAHAKQTAAAVVSHMKQHGHMKSGESIGDVHWTSNRDTEKKAGDHEKTTGVKDVNSNADLIITKHNKSGKKSGFVPISAKYGSNKEPNYKNPGLASMEKDSGHKAGTFSSIMADHNSRMEKVGYKGTVAERHAQHKQDKAAAATGDKKAAARVEKAENSSLEARTQIAKHYAEGINKKGDAGLRAHIAAAVSPQTHHEHIVAHSHVQGDGSAKSVIHNASDIAHDHLSKFEDLKAEHKGISAVITGKHKDTGKRMRVASFGVKASSGPHKGANGFVTLK